MFCKFCGKEFTRKSNSQKYCSDKCKSEAKKLQDKQNSKNRYMNLKKNAPVLTGKCGCCGKEFIKRHGNQKYCSKKCAETVILFQNANAANKYYHHVKKLRGGDTVWGLGSGSLGQHRHDEFESEYNVVEKELQRLGLKERTGIIGF